jgi:hypothetical protein
MWEAYQMPWAPELFSAPVLARLEERRQHKLVDVPLWDGLMTGELDALIGSFAGQPEVHHPVRGRIRGAQEFGAFVNELNAGFGRLHVSVEEVDGVSAQRHGFDEVILHVDGPAGRIGLPVATVADKRFDRRIKELRMYYSSWPLTGRHATRPPLMQPDPELRESDVVADYQDALASGDIEAIMATFEPGAYAREPAGGRHIHRGHDGLRAFYHQLFSNGGGISLEHCAVLDDGRACALEYNVVRWGKTKLPPQAGLAVYVRGQSGKLVAARIYDDVDPPLP